MNRTMASLSVQAYELKIIKPTDEVWVTPNSPSTLSVSAGAALTTAFSMQRRKTPSMADESLSAAAGMSGGGSISGRAMRGGTGGGGESASMLLLHHPLILLRAVNHHSCTKSAPFQHFPSIVIYCNYSSCGSTPTHTHTHTF